MMIDDDIGALRGALASDPTPGPWYEEDWENDSGQEKTTVAAHSKEVVHPGQSNIWPGGVSHSRVAVTDCGDRPLADAFFIATANPDRIQRLIEHVERLTAERDALRKDAERLMFACLFDGYATVGKDRYAFVAECAEDEGRSEPNSEDEVNGLRRLIDAAMAAQTGATR